MSNVPNINFKLTGQQYANLNWKKKNKGRYNLVKTNQLVAKNNNVTITNL